MHRRTHAFACHRAAQRGLQIEVEGIAELILFAVVGAFATPATMVAGVLAERIALKDGKNILQRLSGRSCGCRAA